MKALHRTDLFGWSRFDESRNIDFNSLLWLHPEGNVAVDPLPLSDHERARLREFGGVRHIVITNSDHVRATRDLVELTGARTYGPRAEQNTFPFACDAWLAEGDSVVTGLVPLELDGSKTPGELALVLGGTTLVTGDLVRAHAAGRLDLLPDAKLANAARARDALRRLSELAEIEAVLPGDGWPVFRDGRRALEELLDRVGSSF
jgi:hypothetical protein